eukprot:6451073-Amphidinium_carterae.1
MSQTDSQSSMQNALLTPCSWHSVGDVVQASDRNYTAPPMGTPRTAPRIAPPLLGTGSSGAQRVAITLSAPQYSDSE